jgi:hypothetical protein
MLSTMTNRTEQAQAGAMPDPEVLERPRRRRFTAAYKLSVLSEIDTATEAGAVGAILRREGLYSSHLVEWRRARERGALEALARPHGRPKPNPLVREVEGLRRDNARLTARLTTATRIIEIQGKVSALLGIPLAPESGDERTGS